MNPFHQTTIVSDRQKKMCQTKGSGYLEIICTFLYQYIECLRFIFRRFCLFTVQLKNRYSTIQTQPWPKHKGKEKHPIVQHRLLEACLSHLTIVSVFEYPFSSSIIVVFVQNSYRVNYLPEDESVIE